MTAGTPRIDDWGIEEALGSPAAGRRRRRWWCAETWPRLGAGLLAVVLAAALARWWITVMRLTDPCPDFAPVCVMPRLGLPWIQFVVAVPALLLGAVVAAGLARYAVTRRAWRRLRPLALTLAAVLLVWVIAYDVGILDVAAQT